jgi:hypothetical protein
MFQNWCCSTTLLARMPYNYMTSVRMGDKIQTISEWVWLLVSLFPSTCSFDCCSPFSLLQIHTTCFRLIGHIQVYRSHKAASATGYFFLSCYCAAAMHVSGLFLISYATVLSIARVTPTEAASRREKWYWKSDLHSVAGYVGIVEIWRSETIRHVEGTGVIAIAIWPVDTQLPFGD